MPFVAIRRVLCPRCKRDYLRKSTDRSDICSACIEHRRNGGFVPWYDLTPDLQKHPGDGRME